MVEIIISDNSVLICSSHVQYGCTALITAAVVGHTDIVQYLVEETSARVDATDRVSIVATAF